MKQRLFDCLFLLWMTVACSGLQPVTDKAPIRVCMRQAEVSAGIVDPVYKVPSESESYVIDYSTRTLKVRMSLELENAVGKTESLSVTLASDKERGASYALGYSMGVVLPDDVYSLPSSVDFAENETEKEFFLNIDLKKLETKYPEYCNRNMLVAVCIGSASNYEVSKSRGLTLVVVDGSLFVPSGETVKVGLRQASMYEDDDVVKGYYPIPFTGNPGAYLYDAESGFLDIFLDIRRNGIIPLDGYMVSLAADASMTASVVSDISRGAILPAEACEFPSSIEMESGELSHSFVFRVNVKKLISDYAELSTSNLVFVLKIESVSAFEVDEADRNLVLSIKASSFYPRDPDSNLVKGGDFSEGSEQYWTFNAEQGHNYEGKVAIRDGRLVFSTTGARCLVSLYQAINFEVAGAYNFMALFDNPDGTKNDNARAHITLTRLEPTIGTQFDYSLHPIYCMADVWGGADSGLLLSRTGQFCAEGVALKGMDAEGIFTIGEDDLGTWYIVIGGYSYNDGSLNISFDDIFIGEVID